MIWPMGPLPHTPNDTVVALMLQPFMSDMGTMCDICTHGDETAAEIFQEINNCLNRPLTMDDTIMTNRGVKGRPIKKENQDIIVGYQVEWSIVQQYPVSNDLITISVYSQHIATPHRRCMYRWIVRAHVTVPKQSDTSLMGILEGRISRCFTNYCTEPADGLGVYAVMKDHKEEQEQQHINYDFYLTAASMFKPLRDGDMLGTNAYQHCHI